METVRRRYSLKLLKSTETALACPPQERAHGCPRLTATYRSRLCLQLRFSKGATRKSHKSQSPSLTLCFRCDRPRVLLTRIVRAGQPHLSNASLTKAPLAFIPFTFPKLDNVDPFTDSQSSCYSISRANHGPLRFCCFLMPAYARYKLHMPVSQSTCSPASCSSLYGILRCN